MVTAGFCLLPITELYSEWAGLRVDASDPSLTTLKNSTVFLIVVCSVGALIILFGTAALCESILRQYEGRKK